MYIRFDIRFTQPDQGKGQMAKIRSHRYRYLTSISEELASQANRVRDLIGSRHWLSDGRHKEFLLAALLERHLPAGTIAGPGFVIHPDDPDQCSTEQDILVVDSTKEAPVFQQGGLIICFPRTVLAAISVKTTMEKETVVDTVRGLNTVRNVIRDCANPRSVWCGGFFFEVEDTGIANPSKHIDHFREGMADTPVQEPTFPREHPSPRGPDVLCGGGQFVYRLEHDTGVSGSAGARILAYRAQGTASALFMADLLDHIAVARGESEAEFAGMVDVADLELIATSAL
jgi:hypothetical protein